MESKHSKTPWAIRDFEVIGSYGSNKTICDCIGYESGYEENKANVKHIVKCVNTHEELVKSLQKFLEVINRSETALEHYGEAIQMAEKALQKVTE